MKTIVIAHNYSEDSISGMSYQLSHHLAQIGYRVLFISHKPYFETPQITSFGKGELHVISWPTLERPTRVRDAIWFAKMFLKFKPKWVIGHFVGSNITISIAKILSLGKSNTLAYYHTVSTAIIEDATYSKNKSLQRKKFRKKWFYKLFCDTIICPSHLAKEDLGKVFSIQKSVVIPNAIADRYRTTEVVDFSKITIGYLGRLDSTKGLMEFLKAFECYVSDNSETKINIKIAGGGTLQSEVHELANTTNRITYLGKIPYAKVDSFISECTYMVIPSKFDNLPTVGLESLMLGVPLLISRNTGLTGFLSQKDSYIFDITNFIDVFYFVENNKELTKMKLHARICYEKNFTMNSYFEKIKKLLE